MKIFGLTTLIASLAAAGCSSSALPEVTPKLDPADPSFGIRESRSRPAISYNHRQPVDPSNWRGLNEKLSPANKGAGS